MRREKMNNKGFSLVELIIVIAIMAILSAALAPQLMKYIEKSRVSTDQSSCSSIESCVNAALAEEAVYKDVAKTGTTKGIVVNVYWESTSSGVNQKWEAYCENTDVSTNVKSLIDELKGTLSSLKEPKQTGKNGYVVEIITKQNSTTIGGETGSDAVSDTTTEVGEITCYTSNGQVKKVTILKDKLN